MIVNITIRVDVDLSDRYAAKQAALEYRDELFDAYNEMCDIREDNPCPTVSLVQTLVDVEDL